MYSSWGPAILQRIEITSNKNYVFILLFLFPLLPIVLSLRDAPKRILSKPKWEAQEIVRREQSPLAPRNDDTALPPAPVCDTFSL